MRLLIFLTLTSLAGALELPTTKPTTGTIHRWVSLPATLAPWQQATLHAKVTGYIVKISVDIGDAVKAGQILATLEVPELQADIAKSKAEVAAASIEVRTPLMAMRTVRVNTGISVIAPTRCASNHSRHSQFIFRSAQLSRNCTEESNPLGMYLGNRHNK